MRLKPFIFLIVPAMILSLLSACGGRKDPSEQTPSVTRPPIEEVALAPEDTTDYPLLLAMPFEGLEETPAEQFEILEIANGVRVNRYLGNDEKVRIPTEIQGKRVTAVGDDAFSGQAQLRVLYIPDSVTSFGTEILKGCSALYALRTPLPQKEGTAFLGYLYGAEVYEKNNMPDLRNLDFLVIGGAPEVIPSYALYDCNDLVAIKLPDTVKTLESYSLYRCESLKYLNTDRLEVLKSHSMAYCSSLSSLTLGASLQTVETGALERCDGLRRLSLPFLGTNRGENGYLAQIFGADEPSFSESFYPPLLQSVTLQAGIAAVGDYAFYQCDSLLRVVLPEGITSIGVRAFAGCLRLREWNLPSTLRSVRENAFIDCRSLSSVAFPEGLISLGVNAFSGCDGLREVTLPSTLTVLPNACFSFCTSLTTVRLGGVKEVGIRAFHGCNAMTGVTANGRVDFEDGNELAEELWKQTR